MNTYYTLLKIDNFKYSREELSEWESKCNEFFAIARWSIYDYSEYMFSLTGIQIIFDELETAESIIENLISMLKVGKSKALTIYKPKDGYLIDYYYSKAYYYKALIAYKQKKHSIALQTIPKAYSQGDVFKLKLRRKTLELLKLILNNNEYKYNDALNSFISFYSKELPNNFVIVLDATEVLLTEMTQVQLLVNSVFKRFRLSDNLTIYAYNKGIIDIFTRTGIYYKDKDINTELQKDFKNFISGLEINEKTNSRNIYTVLEEIYKTFSYIEYNNYLFLFILGPIQLRKPTNSDNVTNLTAQLSPSNFNISRLTQEIQEKNLLHTILICNALDELKEERIVQIINSNKRNTTIEIKNYKEKSDGLKQMEKIVAHFII